ncbi:MAG: filamentous haemagglutinin family protein [Thiobacillaceae bacterium]
MNAGTLTVNATQAVFDGAFNAGVTFGPYQQAPGHQPTPGALILSTQDASNAPLFNLQNVVLSASSPTLPPGFNISTPLPASMLNSVQLPVNMFGGIAADDVNRYATRGFGTLEVGAVDQISVSSGVTLDMGPGGSAQLIARNIDINGTIEAPGGNITLDALETQGGSGAPTVSVGPQALLSTAGVWINDSPQISNGFIAPDVINGGSIALAGNLYLDPGSLVNASGGAEYTAAGKLDYGTGGSIALLGTIVNGTPSNSSAIGEVSLGGTLMAYSGSLGGSLKLGAGNIIVGGDAADPLGLALQSDFFSVGGFASYTLNGYESVDFTPGVNVSVISASRLADSQALTQATGADFSQISAAQVLDNYLRTPASLSVNSLTPSGTGIQVGAGASIGTDPGGHISFNSLTQMDIEGSLIAPAGTISLRLDPTQQQGGASNYGGETLTIGAHAELSAAGAFVPEPAALPGLTSGEVLSGGSINITAINNYLDIAPGALIDVSGASRVLDLPAGGNKFAYTPTPVDQPAGSITINATDDAVLAGNFQGQAAGSAAGGRFEFALFWNQYTPLPTDNPQLGNLVHSIIVSQTPEPLVPGSNTNMHQAVISADQLADGGFDSVTLRSDQQIVFSGNVTLAPRAFLQLDSPELLITGGGQVNLDAAHVSLINTPTTNSSERPSTAVGSERIPVVTQSGNGTLDANAGFISLGGNITLNGISGASFTSSGDLSFEGFPVSYSSDTNAESVTLGSLIGSLITPANLTFEAAQIFPATLVDYTVAVANVAASGSMADVSGGKLNILSNGSAVGPVLSAGGSMLFQADTINQAGTLLAPLGTISLQAGSSLTLAAGSVTSVSAAGLMIPFGGTQGVGQTLWYGSLPETNTPPTKQISIDAPDVTVASGAVVNVSGGGDIMATEWVPGIGGSTNVLAAANTFAIIPGMTAQPSDSYIAGLAPLNLNEPSAYNTIQVGAGSGLPAGTYAILPAYYALLPGAYLVNVQAGSAYPNLTPGNAFVQNNGAIVVAGKLGIAGTNIQQSTWSGFSIAPGSDALQEAQYLESNSNFFSSMAAQNNQPTPTLPNDGGQLSIGANQQLNFEGTLLAQAAANGVIGQVDIYSSKIAIVSNVDSASVPSGYIGLSASQLSSLDASVLIGGTRSETANGKTVTVLASDLSIDLNAGDSITAPEMLFAATDSLAVGANTTLHATGSAPGNNGTLTINADASGVQHGALLELSAGNLVPVARPGTLDSSTGALTVAAGAKLDSDGSIVLDSTGAPQFGGTIIMPATGSLAIDAGNIRLGAAPQAAGSLVLDSAQLAQLAQFQNLVLRSYSTIDLYGNVNIGQLGVGSLTLDSAGITGNNVAGVSGASKLAAHQITFSNLSNSTPPVSGDGTGSLSLDADVLVLDGGDKTLSGFSSVNLNAQELVVQNTGTLTAGASLAINAARISAGQSANQQILAYDAAATNPWEPVQITQTAAPAAWATSPIAGGTLVIAGSSVDFAGNITLPSGRLTLAAHGPSSTDGVNLDTGSAIDLSTYEKTFGGINESASAGNLALSADNGSVTANAKSSINLSGGASGGDAGSLNVEAANGFLTLDGSLLASAQPGNNTGSATIDVAELDDSSADNFSSINSALRAGGFADIVYMRARRGDIDIATTDDVAASNIQLVADTGSINVSGVIDASSTAGGGEIQLNAGQNISLLPDSLITARGTSALIGAANAYSNGGQVDLYADGSGSLDFATGAVIDVSAAANGRSSGGTILFSSTWVTNNGEPVLNATLAGQVNVSGPAANGNVTVEGFRSYAGVTNTSTASAVGSQVHSDYAAFMASADTVGNSLALTGVASSDIIVQAGIELNSNGNMTVDSAWDLTNPSWFISGQGGRLVLRAAGNLTVNNSVGLPSNTVAPSSGWSLELAGGADLSSADPLGVNVSQTSGDVTLATANSQLRTSTGSIDVAAGRDFVIANNAAVIYTTGVPNTAGSNFLTGGGDISISAGRNAVGTSTVQWLDAWLRRTTPAGNATSAAGKAAGWWADRTAFSQGIATFGGGNIDITAGGSVQTLSASVASSASVTPNGLGLQAVYGGGDLNINAGGDLLGGQYLVGRGTATLTAGGSVGAPSGSSVAPALWLQGLSLDPALQEADVQVEALGDVHIASVGNPTVMPLSGAINNGANGYRGSRLTFFSFAPDASASLISVDGSVTLDGTAPSVGGLSTAMSSVLPPRFSMVALEGNVSSSQAFNASSPGNNPLYQYPDTNGSFLALAAGSVDDLNLAESDVLPSILPQPNTPAIESGTGSLTLAKAGFVLTNPRLTAPSTLPGYRYAVVADEGSVTDANFYFPQQSLIEAGTDITNVLLNLQNLSPSETGLIVAGRDISYTSQLENGTIWSSPPHIWISGPGQEIIQAGSNLTLGPADSIDAYGNINNPSLTSTASAALTVIAGVTGNVSQSGIDTLFNDLLVDGKINDQTAANQAIAALFSADIIQPGNITMYQSRISTEGGSPIDLLTPDGNINVGLPTPQAGNIGITTDYGGSISAFLSGDMNVNLSKVATLEGGDILLYTSGGSIDAGRGPRSSITTEPPRIVPQVINGVATGVNLLIPPVDAGGSGIRTSSFDPDGPGPLPAPAPGNVYLFAPAGTVNAGEAGVSSSGSLFVVALQVLNASNFSASGPVSGVPSVAPPPVAATPVSSESTASSKLSDEITQSVSSAAAAAQMTAGLEDFRPTLLTVEVLGFGEAGTDGGDAQDCKKPRGCKK